MLFQLPTSRSMDEIQKELEASAVRNKFGIIAVHDLQQTLRNKHVDLAMECRIFEICNPNQAKKVLESDGALSTALPCRISVYGNKGGYQLATMLPTAMMQAFNKPEITAVATPTSAV
ncbi:MAG: DUF302 domain-containing protein [Bryobacteraceae bacterium]